MYASKINCKNKFTQIKKNKLNIANNQTISYNFIK